jgi:hypothetical protein
MRFSELRIDEIRAANFCYGRHAAATLPPQDTQHFMSLAGVNTANGINVLCSNTSGDRHALKAATFRYKKEIDPESVLQFGLVTEDVEKVKPELRGSRLVKARSTPFATKR